MDICYYASNFIGKTLSDCLLSKGQDLNRLVVNVQKSTACALQPVSLNLNPCLTKWVVVTPQGFFLTLKCSYFYAKMFVKAVHHIILWSV